MEIEKVKEIKELLRCMNGEKACTNCYINDIAQEQETCCINIVADMTLDLINELESENERLIAEKQKVLEYMKTDNYAKLKKEDMYWGYQMGIGMLEHEIDRQKDRIAELEKEKTELAKQVVKITGCSVSNEEVDYECNKKLKQFAEKIAKRLINIKGIKEILDETLKEVINE